VIIIPHNARRNRGFTLLEVLVAFSITALALGVMYRIYAKGTTAAILGKEYAIAVAIAESKLADVGADESLGNDYSSGTENKKYQWQIIIRDHQASDEEDAGLEPTLRMKEIELVISWNSLGKQRSIDLQTLRPVPPRT